jgi:hypothetical protein
MFTKASDLFTFIGLSVFGSAAMLTLIYILGEVHGLIITVIILCGQSAQSFVRIAVLQRELSSLRQERGDTTGKVTEKV